VACKRSGGVRFTLKGQANFNLVMFSNVGGSGDVKAAWIKGSSRRSAARVAMQRIWGANWQTNTAYRNQGLSFKLMLGDGKTLEFTGVVPSSWRPGEAFASKNQFYYIRFAEEKSNIHSLYHEYLLFDL